MFCQGTWQPVRKCWTGASWFKYLGNRKFRLFLEVNLLQHPCASKYSGRMGQGPIFRNIQFSKDFPFSCCCFSCCWLQISPWPRPTWTHGLTPDCKWLQMITDLTPQSSPWPSLTWTTTHTHNWLQAITSDKRWLRRNFLQMITDLIPPSPPWPRPTWTTAFAASLLC